MTVHPILKAFNFEAWIRENQHRLVPPVCNKMLHKDTGMIVMAIGGPNARVDFHDDPVEEWFFQYKGNMVINIAEGGRIYDLPIREGEALVHRAEATLSSAEGVVNQLPKFYDEFHKNKVARTCPNCGTLHPGKGAPPEGWITPLV